MVTGQTKAISTPVTAALRSPRVLSFFSAARYSHSKAQHPATLTAVAARARGPKLYTAKSRGSSMASRTSPMIWPAPSLVRIWGEDEPIRFNSL